jgi:hypothetical protein
LSSHFLLLHCVLHHLILKFSFSDHPEFAWNTWNHYKLTSNVYISFLKTFSKSVTTRVWKKFNL